jgi:hypothetical protein
MKMRDYPVICKRERTKLDWSWKNRFLVAVSVKSLCASNFLKNGHGLS